jgi:hypothetical protein
MRRASAIVTAAAMLAVSVLACACVPSAAAPATTAPGAPSMPVTRTIAPGMSEWASGNVEAAGWVTWVDVEGGFWTLKDGPAVVAGAKPPKTIAVLLPGVVSETTIATFDGSYVVARGRIQGGASIRMAGPELVVDDLTVARPPD